MRLTIFPIALVAMLSACTQVHTTSGADYLARYESVSNDGQIDGAIREAAAVEPILSFPARIGLAKIDRGRLVGLRPSELELWTEISERHQDLGEFVAISPLVAEFASDHRQRERPSLVGDIQALVKKVRLGAARMHVDAVLIYGVDSSAHRDSTPLAFFDVTIIGGAILPTRRIKANAVANALLIDVRNGYPYGTATAEAESSELSVTWGAGGRTRDAGARIVLDAVRKLAPEVEKMIVDLAAELEERHERPVAKS